MNGSTLLDFCDSLLKEKANVKSEEERSIMDEEFDIDMRSLSLEESFPKEKELREL